MFKGAQHPPPSQLLISGPPSIDALALLRPLWSDAFCVHPLLQKGTFAFTVISSDSTAKAFVAAHCIPFSSSSSICGSFPEEGMKSHGMYDWASRPRLGVVHQWHIWPMAQQPHNTHGTMSASLSSILSVATGGFCPHTHTHS
ncbi:hypothetical protein DQ04_00411230 [Trypanosoma grayi]|uniref:hypothetical protein n=1 Tax=Trypanosoma grayi TaxID=71804 RepID=UPI0004F4576F|nr:hypothetical protein DQ04_00411230 [Trypanosoma grayi]KEG14559.1 hypothetical protein DQ04_00411230 [Trypanosoma grayi]